MSMRWIVEVSSIARADVHVLAVEAESWQRALQLARSVRGDVGRMIGASVELTDEGHRVSDPVTGTRFLVKEARDTGAPDKPPANSPPVLAPALAPIATAGIVRAPSGLYVRGRSGGDDLISALFESMHELHFLNDALDGGQFCLALATNVLPSRAAYTHFFDLDTREWVLASARGKGTLHLLARRTPESDPILRHAVRARRSVVVAEFSPQAARHQALGSVSSLIVAPVMQAGRALGAIEIVGPLDGHPFTEVEADAITYIAEQYAEFLGSRGIVLDSERIRRAAATR